MWKQKRPYTIRYLYIEGKGNRRERDSLSDYFHKYKENKMKRRIVRIKFSFLFSGSRQYGSFDCLLENADMIERHLRQDGCDRVWISD
jgi:hypothetical protein